MKRFNFIIFALLLILVLSVLAGCSSIEKNSSGSVYESGQTMRMQQYEFATVTYVRNVTIKTGNNGVGVTTGAVVGGIAGSGVGGGKGAGVATVLGAVIGGVVGQAVENSANTVAGVEISLRLRNGTDVIVVQMADQNNFLVGDVVKVVSGYPGGPVRIIK